MTLQKYMKSCLAVILTVCMALNVAVAKTMTAPDVLVKQTVNQIVDNIQTNRAEYTKDNKKLFKMIEDTLIPVIHVDRMANLILGRENSKRATPEQKREFADVFKEHLLYTYATQLLNYTGDEKVDYLPINLADGADKVVVKATLKAPDGEVYPVNVYMSNRRDTKWRAYNFEVAQINFVGTFRSSFGGIIKQKGIDGLIQELREKNKKLSS